MDIAQDFENWMKKRHLDNCYQCQYEGKAKLMDTDAVAVMLFKEFYKQYKK